MIAIETLAEEIKCPHERNSSIPTSAVVSNYKPLTREDIRDLFTLAEQFNKDFRVLSKIQIRLDMGIPGVMCPRQITGDVARKTNTLDKLFVKHGTKGPTEPNIGWALKLTR